MNEDGVLQEVRSAREAYARSHGYDVWAMVADLRARDDAGDWPVVRLSPRRPGIPRSSRSELDPKGKTEPEPGTVSPSRAASEAE
jgi:hypothetical protein